MYQWNSTLFRTIRLKCASCSCRLAETPTWRRRRLRKSHIIWCSKTIPLNYFRTAAEYARAKVLGNSAEVGITKNLRDLFFDTHLLEHGKFSDLHKVVLRLLSGSLREELQRSTAMLDIVDSTGRSPLSWAAQRGDDEAVRLLLAHGADPNNNDNTNMTPLHYAVQAATPNCLLLLIEYGARIYQSTRGWTALHYACSFHDDLAYTKPLLDHGADVNQRTYVGKTALYFAIIRNHLKNTAFLIKIGANLDVLDKEGISPLGFSIKFRRMDAMKLLLQSGAKHEPLVDGHDTLLHLLAKFPDLEIIQYLSDFDVGYADIDARNCEKLTARELMHIHNSNPDIALAFQKLLKKVADKPGQAGNKMPMMDGQDFDDSDSCKEIFEDAVEYCPGG